MRMAIQGLGVAGGFGTGVETLHQALRVGGVEPQAVTIESQEGTDSFPAFLTSVKDLDNFIPKRALRRIDHYAKMTLLGASLALLDSPVEDGARPRLGVVIASGYGALKTTFDFLDSYLDHGYPCSSPTHFSNSVHNAAAAHVSMQFRSTAPSLTVTQFEMSVPSALMTAQQWLAERRVDQVLFGAVDEYCDVMRYCRKQFYGDGENGPVQPVDFDRQSAIVGEGVSFMVLSDEDAPATYGYIDSVYLGNHLASPLELKGSAPLVIGADGHRECGQWYKETVTGRDVGAYADLYGSFPTAFGLDLAVAALSLRERIFFPTPGETCRDLDEQRLSCLKFGPGGDYGLVGLSW